MRDFSRKLFEALDAGPVDQAPQSVTPDQFLNFVNAVVVSVHQDKVDAALAKAAQLSPSQLAQVISQMEHLGDRAALRNAIQSKPGRAMVVGELAKRLFPDSATLLKVLGEFEGSGADDDSDGGVPDELYDALDRATAMQLGVQEHLLGAYEAQGGKYAVGDLYNWLDETGYYDEGYDDGGHSSDEESDEESDYDDAGDYYTQGDDGGGH